MTTQAPNPRDFATWEDAFQYPVPVVRRLEQQLRGSINENRDKLRTLVGISYRDLLGTAERIIDMDVQMRETDDLLSEISQKCNARAIERIAANHARSVKSQRERSGRRNALASTLALLQTCLNIGGRMIKRGGSPLLAAKLIVLARLLHSSAAKSPDPPPVLDILRTRLASLRRRALSHIDKILSKPDVEREALVEALASFSLATTSTPTDVLGHFLKTRAEAMTDLLDDASEGGVHSAMSLLLGTLKDAQMVFPRRLADLLTRLQHEPLLQSQGIRATSELDLDIHERWIAEDVRNFTPYLRHDHLQATQATKIIRTWAQTAKKTILGGLKTLLVSMTDAQKVMTLRKDIILRALTADRKLPGLEQVTFFEDLRACFMEGLGRIAINTSNDLVTVVDKSLRDHNSSRVPQSLTDIWETMSDDVDLGKGALEFRNLIINTSQGKDSQLQSLGQSMQLWSSHMAGLSATIKGMKEDRWNDELDLDLEDDLEFESAPQDLLTKEDPKALHAVMDEEQKKALSSVFEHLESTVSGGNGSGPSSAFLLRLLREVLHHSATMESPAHPINPPSALLDTLHDQLAQQVLNQSLEYRKATKWIPFNRRPATTLWEGTPPVPVQPSPACFRFLHETCKTMKEVGTDLWTVSAVVALKLKLRDTVAESVDHSVLSPRSKGKSTAADKVTNGATHADDTKDETEEVENTAAAPDGTIQADLQQQVVQTFYDVSYLGQVLGSSVKHDITAFDRVLNELREKSRLEESSMDKVRKSCQEYHRRTYLLFGLLAAH